MSAGTRLPGTPLPMHTWTGAGGLTIAGDTWGDQTGPLVVLQHGGGQTRHAWRGAGEALGQAGHHAVAFDARGHEELRCGVGERRRPAAPLATKE